MKDELIGKVFPVLDKGHVILMDVMGDDHDICQAARTSFGKGTRSVSDDRTLIRYLMRHRHTTPFEMAVVKVHVRVPMDCWRQWIRHRMSSVNEYSTRYSEAIDDKQETTPDAWRLQSTTNKQGSGGFVTEWPPDANGAGEPGRTIFGGSPGDYLSRQERAFHDNAKHVYEERLKFGVAREQARKDLPLSTYTESVWKIDLHNLLHFLSLRMDADAQREIRQYANVIGRDIVAGLFPMTWEAFEDYRLNAVTLTALDIEAVHKALRTGNDSAILGHISNQREKDECLAKLDRLGLRI
jgi:thymidylate synthase (FAD)